MVSVLTSMALAVRYKYYKYGLADPDVDVECRIGYQYYTTAVDNWNDTDTPVNITTVPGSGHSYVIGGSYEDTWYGYYSPKNCSILTGRAEKFEIALNDRLLVDKSDAFATSVLVHEFGHAFCLQDNPSSGNQSIMNGDRNRNTLTQPTSDDIAGVNYAYR